MTRSSSSAAVERLPHATPAVIPDCGHLPHVEMPERCAAVLGGRPAGQHDAAA